LKSWMGAEIVVGECRHCTHVTSSRYWRSMSTSPRRFMKYSALRHMGELELIVIEPSRLLLPQATTSPSHDRRQQV
jgi:hypothetical protein